MMTIFKTINHVKKSALYEDRGKYSILKFIEFIIFPR